MVAPPADAAEGPAIADQARLAGAEVVVPHARPAEMRHSIELGLERLARHDPPRSVLLTPARSSRDHAGARRPARANTRPRCPTASSFPGYSGRRGHPIILPWTIAAQIRSLAVGVGVNALVAEHGDSVVELEVSDPEIVADLDTPDDLETGKSDKRRSAIKREFAICISNFQLPDRCRPNRLPVSVFACVFVSSPWRRIGPGESELEIELTHGSKVADLRAALGRAIAGLGALALHRHDRRG